MVAAMVIANGNSVVSASRNCAYCSSSVSICLASEEIVTGAFVMGSPFAKVGGVGAANVAKRAARQSHEMQLPISSWNVLVGISWHPVGAAFSAGLSRMTCTRAREARGGSGAFFMLWQWVCGVVHAPTVFFCPGPVYPNGSEQFGTVRKGSLT